MIFTCDSKKSHPGSLQMIDSASDARRSKPVVDVDDAHAACAAVEHSEQRRNAVEADAVTDTRWHGNHGNAHEATDHAGQCAFHSRDHDENARAMQPILRLKEAVQAGDADVVETIDAVSHELGCHYSLFGDW